MLHGCNMLCIYLTVSLCSIVNSYCTEQHVSRYGAYELHCFIDWFLFNGLLNNE